MRVLLLSWEYPPLMVGGLGRHVYALSRALAAADHEVTVVTRAPGGTPSTTAERDGGLTIVRVPEDALLTPGGEHAPFAAALAVNHALTRAALKVARSAAFDVVHAHDWLVAHSAVTVREQVGIPLVTTVHATEAGRHQGWLPGDLSRSIHSVECWLANQSDRVVVCSHYMRWEVHQALHAPAERIHVIPNGAEPDQWAAEADRIGRARVRFAGHGPLLGFAGRLVYEKGVQDLIAALPTLRAQHPGLRLVIAGDGPYAGELRQQTDALHLRDAVSFAGFLDGDLAATMAATDAMVVPSRYEPFGMVAIEASAAGAPVAAAATGGLKEIVEPGRTGMTFRPGEPEGLGRAVSRLLADRSAAAWMVRTAQRMVADRYSWAAIANRTVEQYARARRDPRPDGMAERLALPEGNLLFT
ncbi:(1-_4)-alpha-D-glucan synthase (UDP-glucose) [Krasilnikovia cinnamomea]|uniref:(1->4)-alpha-D-glucan synthase (UDP-glucose) n=1 Tax=Krasilnikovia cinnamomea TaxID=349313 RepID=A0A4V2G768_9ACTN|nr:glycosyltransferase family 4 protein [Krasilnikovia cinnamomea]RZU51396.1 (1->4)-alpha-D-glucan synthase (UDP-glucose) [Krasilnikovia cinnamomea]